MSAEVNPAPVSIEAALPLYLAAKAAVKEAELGLLAAQKAAGEEPPESLKEELARLTTSLIGDAWEFLQPGDAWEFLQPCTLSRR